MPVVIKKRDRVVTQLDPLVGEETARPDPPNLGSVENYERACLKFIEALAIQAAREDHAAWLKQQSSD